MTPPTSGAALPSRVTRRRSTYQDALRPEESTKSPCTTALSLISFRRSSRLLTPEAYSCPSDRGSGVSLGEQSDRTSRLFARFKGTCRMIRTPGGDVVARDRREGQPHGRNGRRGRSGRRGLSGRTVPRRE